MLLRILKCSIFSHLVLLITTLCTCLGQEDVKSFYLDTYKYDNLITETDQNGYLYLCFYYKNKFETKIIDKDKNLVGGRTFKLKDFDKKNYPIGIGYDRSFMYIYFMDFKTNQIRRISYDKDNIMIPRISAPIQIPKEERYIETVNIAGSFKIITLDSKTNDFVVRTAYATFDSLHQIRINSGCENLEKSFLKGEKEVYAKRIYKFHDNLENSNFYTKIYATPVGLKITIDYPNYTHFFDINLINNTSAYKKLYFHLHKTDDKNILAGASLIRDDRLFRITHSNSQLNFSIIDLDSAILVKNYNILPDKEIDLKTGPIISEINYEDRSDTKEFLKASDEFLENIDPEGLGIAINDFDTKDYFIQIGSSKLSYYTVNSPGYGPSFGMGGGVSIWMGGGMGNPSIFNAPSMNTYSKTTNVFFNAILDKESLKKSDTNNSLSSIYEKIKNYENLKVNNAYKGLSTILENDSEILYGYFNGKDDLYHIVKFKQ